MQPRFLKQCAVSLWLLAFSLLAQAAVNLSDPIPFDPQVKVGKLDNGLTYFIRQNTRPEKRVEMRLVLKVGSVLEDDDQQGLAHFTEHMAFNGSRNFKKNELVSYLQSIGMRFGGDLNASTGFNQTVYMLTVPTDKPDNINKGFLVLEDWAQGMEMSPEEIDKERGVILEEMRRGRGAQERARKVWMPVLFNGSKYAERLPIGKEEVIKNFPYTAIQRFYADWYRPDLMAVVVVGDIDPAQAEAMVRTHFAKLKNPANPRLRPETPVPAFTQSKALVVTDPELTTHGVDVIYPVQPLPRATTLADYRAAMVKSLTFAMLGERLRDASQKETSPFLGGSSHLGSLVKGYENYMMFAQIGPRGVEPALQALFQENARARQFGFTVDELDRARRNRLRGAERQYNERDKTESTHLASGYVSGFLMNEAVPGITHTYAWTNELLPTITLDEVNQYARRVIPVEAGASANTLTVFKGSSKDTALIPTTAQLQTLVQTAAAQPVVQAQAQVLPTSLMPTPPKAGTIVAQTTDAALGLTTLTLSNGVKVILKPTDFKNDQVLLSASRFGGQSLYGDADALNARYALGLVGSMGLGSFKPTDVSKILAGKAASFGIKMGEDTETFSGSSSSADVETMLQMLHLRMTTQRKDIALFKNWVEANQTQTKNQLDNPGVAFLDFAMKTVMQNHPRAPGLNRPEDFVKIDLERSMAIERERMGSAKGLTFALVGSFDVEKVKPLIATYIASLPTPDIPVQYKDLGVRPVSGVVKKTLHMGKDDKALDAFFFSGPAVYSLEENARLVMLAEVLNLKITEVLREKLSLIYSGRAMAQFIRDPVGGYFIMVGLPCAPQNVDTVTAGLFAEIERLKTEGPQQTDLDKVKKNLALSVPTSARTNGFWVSNLAESAHRGTDPALLLDSQARLKRIESVTPADIQAAAQRYFKQDNYVQMVMLPAVKKAE